MRPRDSFSRPSRSIPGTWTCSSRSSAATAVSTTRPRPPARARPSKACSPRRRSISAAVSSGRGSRWRSTSFPTAGRERPVWISHRRRPGAGPSSRSSSTAASSGKNSGTPARPASP
ncbi:MAG: hypothetical protein MZV64_10750 [Ignavibacteriales bacterium]|nr:hypothetical protein [Ignavibacteriales bacterium]